VNNRVYYLEEPLSSDDAEFVSEQLFSGAPISQVRIPHVLPTLTDGSLSESRHRRHEQLLRKSLRMAGIGTDRDTQVVLVAPNIIYWHAVLSGAVEAETGMYPWMVQTKSHRDAIDNPGETRILDMEGLFGRKP
jgi:hypothetical protein